MKKTALIVLVMVLILLACGTVALAQSGYQLTASAIAGGGGGLAAGSYQFSGAIGQADAGPLFQAGSYTLQGGFWRPEDGHRVFLPRLVR